MHPIFIKSCLFFIADANWKSKQKITGLKIIKEKHWLTNHIFNEKEEGEAVLINIAIESVAEVQQAEGVKIIYKCDYSDRKEGYLVINRK